MQYDETTGALRIADLIAGYLNGQLNADEENELFTWVGLNNYNADTFIKIVDEGNLEKYRDELFTYNTVAALEKVKARLSEATIRDIKPKRKWYIPAAAAAVFILFSAVIFLYLNKPSKPQIAQHYKNDVAPGGNKAILTLANGSQISLTDAKNGKLALQGSTTISKTGSGRIVYNPANTPSQPAVAYNTITTPRGGQYQLILPDGTKVWLNAASSLKYPTAFAANKREVELSGEAYFEVVHNGKAPFRVISNGETIEDIGTHFNINAYTDEVETKTTLLEGRVRITSGANKMILKPGQQSLVQNGQHKIVIIDNADPEEAVAWKNGYFKIDDEDLKTVMRNISRWYDVDVEYKGDFGNGETYLGEVSRSKNMSAILKIMEATGNVHFKIEGRRVTVMP